MRTILRRQNHVFVYKTQVRSLRLAPASFQRTDRMAFCLPKNDDRNGSTGVLEFCGIFDVYTTGSCCWINYSGSPFICTSKAAFHWTVVVSPRFLRGINGWCRKYCTSSQFFSALSSQRFCRGVRDRCSSFPTRMRRFALHLAVEPRAIAQSK